MTVRTYTPGLAITLIKMVGRKDGVAARYAQASRTVDLTPFLGDGGVIQTTKSLRDPAGGFTVSFGDQVDQETRDTLYALIEPMDMIEIRASRNAWQFTGGPLPLIMRGFVSSVRRSESWQGEGPNRTVIIGGHDFGKLWEIHNIWFELAVVTDQPVLTVFGLQAQTGIDVAVLAVEDFIRQFVEKVMNPKLQKMEEYSSQTVKGFVLDSSVKRGCIVPSMLSNLGAGSYWSIMSGMCDQPWNELFIRDADDAPHVVFRPAPFRDLDGKYILQDAADPGTVEIDPVDVVSWDVARSDARVANFFWVPPGSSSLDTNQFSSVGALVDGSATDFDHPNNNPVLYGERKMQLETVLIPDDSQGPPANLPAGERESENGRYVEWYRQRAKELRDMNRDNAVLEDGGAVLKGSEDLVIGKYLRLVRGVVTSELYMTSVSHTIQPLNSWTTSVQLERGTGFLARAKVDSNPYYGEGRDGPYTA